MKFRCTLLKFPALLACSTLLFSRASIVQVHIISSHVGSIASSLNAMTEPMVQSYYQQGSWAAATYFNNRNGTNSLGATVVKNIGVTQGLNAFISGVFQSKLTDAWRSSISVKEPTDDYMLLPYEICPNYKAAVKNWLISDAFIKRKQESLATISAIKVAASAAAKADSRWALDDSVFTLENFARFYQVFACALLDGAVPAAMAAHASDVMSITSWLETSKFGTPLASNLLVQELLDHILQSMREVASPTDPSASPAPVMHVYAGFHAAMVALLSGLGLYSDYPDLAISLPGNAALLAIEMHVVGNAYFSRLLYKDSASSPPRYLEPKSMLTAAVDGARFTEDSMTGYSSFYAALFQVIMGASDSPAPLRATVDERWCTNCDNTQAGVCVRQALASAQAQIAVLQGSSATPTSQLQPSASRPGEALLLMSVGLVLGGIFGALISVLYSKVCQHSKYVTVPSTDDELFTPRPPSSRTSASASPKGTFALRDRKAEESMGV